MRTQSEILGILDTMPWNRFHSRACAVLGLGWGMDAFEVTLIGSILGVLGPYWHLSGYQLSLILASWFAGIMLGAIGFGAIADRFGRRAVFLGSLTLYGVATFITALSPNVWVLLLLRLIAGIGVGAEYSAVNAAVAEFIPSARRGFAASFIMNFWSLGTLAAALLALIVFALLPTETGWRIIFATGGIVALLSFWFRRRLPESPRWLLEQGRMTEAEAVVAAMGTGNVLITPPANVNARRRLGRSDFTILLRRHKAALALGCLLDFAEAGGYYGLFAFLPLAVLPNLHLAPDALPIFYIMGSFGALIGGIAVSFLLDRLGRKPVVSVCYGATALACLVFAGLAGQGTLVVLSGFVIVNLLATASWVGAYPTFSELFPTYLRARGIGVSVAVGRIGAIISPFLIAKAAHAGIAAALGVLAGFWALGFVAMLVWSILGIEGRGLSLEQIVEPA